MRISYQILLCALFTLFSGCATNTSVKPPSGWVQVDAHEFEFYVPPDVKTVPVQGIDSYVGKYEGEAISFGFDYGMYSDPLVREERKGYIIHDERIGGKRARIVSFYNPGKANQFDYAIGIHFPEVNSHGVKLSLYATCKTTNEYETARMIFRTIKFK